MGTEATTLDSEQRGSLSAEEIAAQESGSGKSDLTIDTAGPAEEYEGLFDDEEFPSEDQLKGFLAEEEAAKGDESETKPESEKTSEGDGTASPQPSEESEKQATGEETPAEETPAEEPTGQPGEDQEKPPKGYVPKQALDEERTRRKELSTKLQELEQQITALQQGSVPGQQQSQEASQQEDPEFKDFQVLSDQEFDKLINDDPVEAIKYQNKLMRYRDRQREQHVSKARQEVVQQREQALVQEAAQAMAEAAPGIFDENSTVKQDLSKFAQENGFGSEYLSYMTDPRTRIIPPGQSEPVVVGRGAAELVGMINNAYQKTASSDPETLRSQVRQEVEQELREKITQELTEKFKGQAAPQSPGLGDAPPAGSDTPVDTKKVYTEDEWMSLSAEARAKILGAPGA